VKEKNICLLLIQQKRFSFLETIQTKTETKKLNETTIAAKTRKA
jgi:hypothetical protein